MSALKYWLWLSSIRGLGAARTAALVDAFGSPEDVFASDETVWLESTDIPEPALAEMRERSTDRAERILELCDRTGTNALTMQDAIYPMRLREIYAPPIVLYYKGKLPAFDEEAALGVVGTRNPTAYGQNAAMKLSYQLAKNGMLIVSGMAKGLDAAAHLGALRAGKPTVAVLGCGTDVIYPAENRELYEDLVAAGAVLSEYPPGTRAAGEHFPARNRIIAGLVLGVLVVEAPKASGALITANLALEAGRDVFAIPGSIDNRESAGCHMLIRDGAELVTCAEDVLSVYRAQYAHKLSGAPEPKLPDYMPPLPKAKEPEPPEEKALKAVDITELVSGYGPDQQSILLAIAGVPMNADEIIDSTGLPAPLALSELTMLELDGAVTQLPGRRYKLNLT